MQDEETNLLNACTDLVSLKRWEAFPMRLLTDKRSGEWIGVRELCQQIGIAGDDLPPDLFATHLPDPMAHDGYVVIVFYDDDSKWSMAAHYNRSRLAGGLLPSLATSGALPAANGSPFQQATPAAER